MVGKLDPDSPHSSKGFFLLLDRLRRLSRAVQEFSKTQKSASSGMTRKDFLGLVAAAFAMTAFAPMAQAQTEQKSEHEPPGAPEKNPEPVMSQEQKWRSRFPQPVLVSDLFGRKMLDSRQGVLGNITEVVETKDHAIMIAFARRRLLFFSGETVVVPMFATALLGPFVMILDLSDDQISALPVFSPDGTKPVDPRSQIKMALTKH